MATTLVEYGMQSMGDASKGSCGDARGERPSYCVVLLVLLQSIESIDENKRKKRKKKRRQYMGIQSENTIIV